MEIIFIVLIFIGPGVSIKAYQNYMSVLSDKNNSKKTLYEQMFTIVANSIITMLFSIGCINITILILFGKSNVITSLSGLIALLDKLTFTVPYIMINAIMGLLWVKIYEGYIAQYIHNVRNKILTQKYGVKSISKEEPTVWEDIFFNPKITEEWMIVSIFKDGDYITSGRIAGYNEGKTDINELEIRNVYEVEKVLAMDKEKKDAKKWLGYVDFEYFNAETGLQIKFYDVEQIKKHWDEI